MELGLLTAAFPDTKLTEVADASRAKARDYVSAMEARGGTAIHDALQAALTIDRSALLRGNSSGVGTAIRKASAGSGALVPRRLARTSGEADKTSAANRCKFCSLEVATNCAMCS